MKLRGDIYAAIPSSNPEFLNGKIRIYNVLVADAKETYVLDSIKVDAISTAENDTITVRSQFINAAITGKFQIDQAPTALSNSIAKYYNTNPKAPKKTTKPQQFDMKIAVKDDPILFKLVPELKASHLLTLQEDTTAKAIVLPLMRKFPRLSMEQTPSLTEN